jgi:nucleoid-associated protein YgaU
MPNDARLGLVVGVTLVILIAVLFFAKEGKSSVAGNVQTTAAAPRPPAIGGAPPAPGAPSLPRKVRSHKVREGESLSSVSRRYYGEGAARVSFLFNANRDRLRAPDYVPIGTVLLVPDLPSDLAEQDE